MTNATNSEMLSKDANETWNTTTVNGTSGRFRVQNVVTKSAGPMRHVIERAISLLETFLCFVSSEILNKIVSHSN